MKPNRLRPVCYDKAVARSAALSSAASAGVQGDELTDRFLRILTELAVTHCLSGESGAVTMRPGLLYFVAIDAYVRLLVLLINGERRALAALFGALAGAVSRTQCESASHPVKLSPCMLSPVWPWWLAIPAHACWSVALAAPDCCIQSPCSAVY